jgi:hypothetical protein
MVHPAIGRISLGQGSRGRRKADAGEVTTRLFIPRSGEFAATPTGAVPVRAVSSLSAHACANNRPFCKPRVLIFSRRRREIAAIEG